MLKIINLKTNFAGTEVLKGINLELQKNEILGIVGESGAGKTTLALSIMGLSGGRLDGEIILSGQNLVGLPEKNLRRLRWKKISMVFQNTAAVLNPVMTAYEQIAEPLWEHENLKSRETKVRVHSLLEYTGLPREKASCYPHQLSGGEKQQVLLAMALAGNPELLLLDEPTSGLDALTKTEIVHLLQKIARERALILMSHDIASIARLSHRLAVLYAGLILEEGPAAAVLKHPAHPYTRGLLRSYPGMLTTKDLQGIPGNPAAAAGCLYSSRCTQQIAICRQKRPELQEKKGKKIACHRGGIITLLALKDLGKKYGKNEVLQSINLELQEGETLTVVGKSGSGKTTLARCIMGLEKTDRGEILWEGKKLLSRTKDFYRSVQMIFQNPGDCLSHRFNVLEAVTEPLAIQKMGTEEERKARARKVLQEVELPADAAFLARYPHHLSGGEIQRIVIARALILNPRLLLADEPTSALDASIQAKILKLLLSLQEKRGLAVLFITHDIALARKVSDRAAVLQSGHIVETGPAEKVFASPVHPYTKELLQAASLPFKKI